MSVASSTKPHILDACPSCGYKVIEQSFIDNILVTFFPELTTRFFVPRMAIFLCQLVSDIQLELSFHVFAIYN